MTIKDIMLASVLATSRGAGTVTFASRQIGTPSPAAPAAIVPGLRIVRDDDSVLTVGAGTLDLSTGGLTATMLLRELTGAESFVRSAASSTQARRFSGSPNNWSWPLPKDGDGYKCSHAVTISTGYADAVWGQTRISGSGSGTWLALYDGGSVIDTASDLKAWIAAEAAAGRPVQVLYELETPETVTLSGTELRRAVSTLGKNKMIAAMLRGRKEN